MRARAFFGLRWSVARRSSRRPFASTSMRRTSRSSAPGVALKARKLHRAEVLGPPRDAGAGGTDARFVTLAIARLADTRCAKGVDLLAKGRSIRSARLGQGRAFRTSAPGEAATACLRRLRRCGHAVGIHAVCESVAAAIGLECDRRAVGVDDTRLVDGQRRTDQRCLRRGAHQRLRKRASQLAEAALPLPVRVARVGATRIEIGGVTARETRRRACRPAFRRRRGTARRQGRVNATSDDGETTVPGASLAGVRRDGAGARLARCLAAARGQGECREHRERRAAERPWPARSHMRARSTPRAGPHGTCGCAWTPRRKPPIRRRNHAREHLLWRPSRSPLVVGVRERACFEGSHGPRSNRRTRKRRSSERNRKSCT